MLSLPIFMTGRMEVINNMEVKADDELEGLLEGRYDVRDFEIQQLEDIAVTLEDMIEKLDKQIEERLILL